MLFNYLETARMGESGVIKRIDTANPNTQYIGIRSFKSNGLADTAAAAWKIYRITTVGTEQIIDRPMDTNGIKYVEDGHIRDNRTTLNRQ